MERESDAKSEMKSPDRDKSHLNRREFGSTLAGSGALLAAGSLSVTITGMSGCRRELQPGNTMRIWGLHPPPQQPSPYVINVAATSPAPVIRYPDPALGHPYVFVPDIGSGFGRNCFPYDTDVTCIMPKTQLELTAGFEIWGGRNIRIIGGDVVAANDAQFRFVSPLESVYVEGLRLDVDAMGEADTMVTRDNAIVRDTLGGTGAPWPDYYLHHCYLSGTQGSFTGVHGDTFQAQSLIGKFVVEETTVFTQYQGFFIEANTTRNGPQDGIVIQFCDFNYWPRTDNPQRPHYISFYIPGKNFCFGADLHECYLEEHPDFVPWYANSTVPATRATPPDNAVYDAGTNSISWPDVAAPGAITGTATQGPPPGGNFAANAGTSYVSPWGTPS